MKILILVTSGGNFGLRGRYNRQEVGLARALAAEGHEVEVHKSVARNQTPAVEPLGENCCLRDHPSPFFGNHGWFSLSMLEQFGPDVVLMFSDLQLCAPSVARWCRRNRKLFIPYVGTIRSNRPGRRLLERISSSRNIRAYKSVSVVAKGDEVAEELRARGVTRVTVMPVGLDITDLAKRPPVTQEVARNEMGLGSGPVLGFVGQMLDYKRPQLLPDLLDRLNVGQNWSLAMVGDGPLASELDRLFAERSLKGKVTWLRSLPNDEMWKLYLASDVIVNLNPNEILGMAILEAMYHRRPVVAVSAPGPKLLIRSGTDGYVTQDDLNEVAECIRQTFDRRCSMGESARQRILEGFTWSTTVHALDKLLNGWMHQGAILQ